MARPAGGSAGGPHEPFDAGPLDHAATIAMPRAKVVNRGAGLIIWMRQPILCVRQPSARLVLHNRSPSGEGRLVGLVQLVRNSPYGQP